jgi:ribosome-binding factor A
MSRPAKPGAPSHRLERVAEQVRHVISDVLARGEVDDPLLAVRMSPDLKLATVAVLPLGGRDTPQTLAALQANKKALRAQVAARVNLKYAPDLRFVVDETFEAQERMDAILRSPRVARDLDAPDEEEDLK